MNTPNPTGQQWHERSSASESKLGETEPMFRLLFERSADAMSLFDPETGRFVESNDAVVRQIGAPNKEALRGISPDEISPQLQADGISSSAKAIEMVKLALANGSHRFEWLARRYDGVELPLDVVLTAVPVGGRTMLFVVSRDISGQKKAECEILRLNASLEQRVAERTVELVMANDQLRTEIAERRRQQTIEGKRGLQTQKHRDMLMELARAPKSDFSGALATICSRAAATLDVDRVSYWSLADKASAIVCEAQYILHSRLCDQKAKGMRLAATDCPAYFAALSAKVPVVANDVFTHPATSGLEGYLRPLGITSMLDAPVWVRGELVGVLCHEHVGPPRERSAEEVEFAS